MIDEPPHPADGEDAEPAAPPPPALGVPAPGGPPLDDPFHAPPVQPLAHLQDDEPPSEEYEAVAAHAPPSPEPPPADPPTAAYPVAEPEAEAAPSAAPEPEAGAPAPDPAAADPEPEAPARPAPATPAAAAEPAPSSEAGTPALPGPASAAASESAAPPAASAGAPDAAPDPVVPAAPDADPPVPAPVPAASVPVTAAAAAGRAAAPPAAAPEFAFGPEEDGAKPRRVLWFLSGAGLGLLVLALGAGLAVLLSGTDDRSAPSTEPVVTQASATTVRTAPRTTATKPKAPPAPLSPQLASARISTSSFGPIQVGMTLDQAQAAAGTALDAGAGGSACRAYTPAGGPDGVQVFTAAGTVAGFEVTGGDVSTLSGIKVGDSGDQVRSTYGAAIQSEPSAAGGGETLTFTPASAADPNRVVFLTDASGTVRTIRSGRASGPGGAEGCA